MPVRLSQDLAEIAGFLRHEHAAGRIAAVAGSHAEIQTPQALTLADIGIGPRAAAPSRRRAGP